MSRLTHELGKVPGVSGRYAHLLWEYQTVRTVADYIALSPMAKLGGELDSRQLAEVDRAVRNYLSPSPAI